MKRFISAFSLVIGLLTTAYTQDVTFRVIVNQGVNTVESKGVSSPLKIGQDLQSLDKLILDENGYVALVTSLGSTIEIHGRDNRTFELNDLPSKSKSDLIGKYANYIMQKMSPEAIEKNKKEYASVTGAVQRATGLVAYMKKTSRLYEPYAIIRWSSVSGKAPYSIKLNDGFGNQLFEGNTTNNFFKIDFMMSGLNSVDLVIASFSDADGAESSYSIQRGAPSNEVFEKEISSLKNSLNVNSAFENLILAEFYEQNNYLLDASTCFEKAKILEPDVDYFNLVYIEFLKRNKFGDSLN